MEYSKSDFRFIGHLVMRPEGDPFSVRGLLYSKTPGGRYRHTRMDVYYIPDEDKAYWLQDLKEKDPENFGILIAHLGLIPPSCFRDQSADWIVYTSVSLDLLSPGILILTTAKFLEKPQIPMEQPKGPSLVSRSVFLDMLPAFIYAYYEPELKLLTSGKPGEQEEFRGNIRERMQDEFAEQMLTEKEVSDTLDKILCTYPIK